MGFLEDHLGAYWRNCMGGSLISTFVTFLITLFGETSREMSSLWSYMSSLYFSWIHYKVPLFVKFLNILSYVINDELCVILFSILMKVLLNSHENLFLLNCPFINVFAYVVLSTIFELNLYFFIFISISWKKVEVYKENLNRLYQD